MTATLHRRLSGESDEIRLVEDGVGFFVFLFAPAALLARRLWGAFAIYVVLVAVFVGAAEAGWIAGWAVVLAVLVVHLAFAIDIPRLDRNGLAARGWPAVAVSAPSGTFFPVGTAPPAQAPRVRPARPDRSDDVLGLFPGERA